jgi:hypothetical protein
MTMNCWKRIGERMPETMRILLDSGAEVHAMENLNPDSFHRQNSPMI